MDDQVDPLDMLQFLAQEIRQAMTNLASNMEYIENRIVAAKFAQTSGS